MDVCVYIDERMGIILTIPMILLEQKKLEINSKNNFLRSNFYLNLFFFSVR